MSEVNKKLELAENAATTIQVLNQPENQAVPFAIVQGSHGYQAIGLEEFLPKPIRHKRSIGVKTDKSFCDYFNKFSNSDSAIVFNIKDSRVIGVIDFGNKKTPEREDHKVVYSCPASEQWKTWLHSSKCKMSQQDFAEFIENNIDDFSKPNGAHMLEIATKFQLIRKATFGSSIKTASGEFQFAYSEENQKGTIEIPTEISLGLAPFESGQHYEVKARIRYRLREGDLAFWYEIIAPDEILKDAFNDVREAVLKNTPKDILVLDI